MKRFWRGAGRAMVRAYSDDITGESAKVAYYFFLSIFPLFITIFALTGIFGGPGAFDLIMREVRFLLPVEVSQDLGRFVGEITERDRPGMLSLGLALTLWSASNILVALVAGLNRIYRVARGRVWWRLRLMALVVVLSGSLLVTAGVAAILAGPQIVQRLGLAYYWVYLRWPVVFCLITGLLWLLYYILPNRNQSRHKLELLVGALVGTLLWTLGTALFRFYLTRFADYSRIYGFMGGVIILLLWFYITALAILLGGVVSAHLRQPPGEPAGGP